MNFDEWVFHDVEHIYLQLIKKISCAIYSGQLSAGKKSRLFGKWQRYCISIRILL